MAKIFTIANRKGGVGKSTIAINLAIALSKQGNTLLVDTDDQLSAHTWNEYRTTQVSENQLKSIPILNNLANTIKPIYHVYDSIVIDMAGKDSQAFREALLISNKLIVPMQPSYFDLAILKYISDTVTQAKLINNNLQAYVVINRASANYRNVEAIEAKKLINNYPIFKLLDTVIHDRKQFRDSTLKGLSVQEMGDSKARDEINKFLSEVL